MKTVGLKRGVVIVDEPPDRRDPRDGQPADLRQQLVRPTGSATRPTQAPQRPDKPLLNHAIQAHYPPGSTYKLVTGTGGLADGKISRRPRSRRRGYLTLGDTRFYDWNHRGFGACDIYCGFGHSSDTFFFQVAGMLGIDRLALLGPSSTASASRPGSTCPARSPGIVPSNQWKQDALGAADLPGRDLPGRASARATTS